ncbi:MAG: hypothetical protein Q7T01_03155 [bacterium]|nr:hypothetical protein [bacterium]
MEVMHFERARAARIEAPELSARAERRSERPAHDVNLARLLHLQLEQDTWVVIRHRDGTAVLSVPLCVLRKCAVPTQIADGALDLPWDETRPLALVVLLYELDFGAYQNTARQRRDLTVEAELVTAHGALCREHDELRRGLWLNPKLPTPLHWRTRAFELLGIRDDQTG